MSEWTEIIDGIADHIALLKELGERTAEVDPDVMQALRTDARTPAGKPAAASPAAASAPAAAFALAAAPALAARPVPPATAKAAPAPAPASAPFPAHSPEERRRALGELAARADACDACALRQQRTRCVPGQGNPVSPDIMFIGEAPGADEDRAGLAFVGAAGQFLTKMIQAMGYTRDTVFIANICKCRPPGNRTPLPEEMQTCLPFLREQIRIIQPKTIVLLGGTAVRGLLNTQTGVTRLQGQWSRYEGIPVMPTYHPAYILRFESFGDTAGLKKAKTEVWHTLKLVLAQLGRPVPQPSAQK
jgi:DNA polymerase